MPITTFQMLNEVLWSKCELIILVSIDIMIVLLNGLVLSRLTSHDIKYDNSQTDATHTQKN